jgi:hypothetical protein
LEGLGQLHELAVHQDEDRPAGKKFSLPSGGVGDTGAAGVMNTGPARSWSRRCWQ